MNELSNHIKNIYYKEKKIRKICILYEQYIFFCFVFSDNKYCKHCQNKTKLNLNEYKKKKVNQITTKC